MIAAAVTEGHFAGRKAACQRHELMSEANSEDRNAGLHDLGDFGDDGRIVGRVSGAVCQHDAVKPLDEILGLCVIGLDDDVAAPFV
ncbi:hypothetical protein SDC9_99821 [bioreactor metagenome]|uniref:Uncharacterized protein n=1 Tax=bioreactor metagenome TaxID=1076179 RepID=A0A645AJ60_9ZZZZ